MAIFEQDKVFYEEAENGDKIINLPITRANNVEGLGRSANTKFVAGEVVYVDNNKKIALKCIVGGTTGANELDVSSKAIGDTVTDGSVTWQVCNRTSDVTSVNGQTGDVVIPEPNYPVTSVNGMTGAVQIPVNDGTVSLKLDNNFSANSTGNKTLTISSLTPNKPVYIGVLNAKNVNFYPLITSGILLATAWGDWDSTFQMPQLAQYTYARHIAVIPTGTTITLTIKCNSMSGSIRIIAYQ